MVQYAQQTDPNKAKASSIGEKIETPVEQKPVTTEIPKIETPVTETTPVVTNTSNEKRLEKLRPTGTTTTTETKENKAPDWIGQPFASNAKIIEEQTKAKALETSKRLATSSANIIATDYNNG